MAQRFGGQFSPDTKTETGGSAPKPGASRPFKGKVPTRLGGRVNLLFVLPFLFAIIAFFSNTTGMVLNLAGFALMMGAAWLTREGIRAQAAFDARTVASRPPIPRKMLGSLAIGGGIALAATAQGGIIEGTVLGGLGTILHFLSFGPDPLKNKGIEGDDFQSSRVARAVDGAEVELKAMTAAIAALRDRNLSDRVDGFQTTARDMFRIVEQDHRDLTAARKYLGIYLSGAREATEKFATYYQRTGETAARADYLTLLDDLERNFAAKTETLLQDDRSALDIEMDVLRERLAREPHMHTIRSSE